GHVHQGLLRVQLACTEVRLDPFSRDRLLHCIASHHGLPEHGAATKPATYEAIMLHNADVASAELAMVQRVVSDAGSQAPDWSEWNQALDRRVWIKAALASSNREPLA